VQKLQQMKLKPDLWDILQHPTKEKNQVYTTAPKAHTG